MHFHHAFGNPHDHYVIICMLTVAQTLTVWKYMDIEYLTIPSFFSRMTLPLEILKVCKTRERKNSHTFFVHILCSGIGNKCTSSTYMHDSLHHGLIQDFTCPKPLGLVILTSNNLPHTLNEKKQKYLICTYHDKLSTAFFVAVYLPTSILNIYLEFVIVLDIIRTINMGSLHPSQSVGQIFGCALFCW